ncbi:MAG TPA: lytic transglycosylase domain-containing protein [Terriglobales bacterium]|nr:lytic transglycosylase domain-containing protein [Terriglobales bacterium]
MASGLISIGVVTAALPAAAQGIVPVEENGHKVFMNADGPVRQQPTKLVYWSSAERRWKVVPARGSATMKQAESAMADVQRELATPPRPNATVTRLSQSHLDQLIDEAAARHQVDPNLVRAVIKVESNFNPNAVSRKGAIGLMQLMPSTARELNVTNPFDPQQNVDAGVRHLKTLLETNGGDVSRSLAAYNAGQGAVRRSGGIPPYAETRNYVKQITHLYAGGSGPSWMGQSKPVRVTRDVDGAAMFTNVY